MTTPREAFDELLSHPEQADPSALPAFLSTLSPTHALAALHSHQKIIGAHMPLRLAANAFLEEMRPRLVPNWQREALEEVKRAINPLKLV